MPKLFLNGWSGKYLHCDGYSGYKKLEGITLCECFVHVKRKFHDALVANLDSEAASTGESYIQKFFAIEDYVTEKECPQKKDIYLEMINQKRYSINFMIGYPL